MAKPTYKTDRSDLNVDEYVKKSQTATGVFNKIIEYCKKHKLAVEKVGAWEEAWEVIAKSLKHRRAPALKNAWEVIYKDINPDFLSTLVWRAHTLIDNCERKFPKLIAGKNSIEDAKKHYEFASDDSNEMVQRIFEAKQAIFFASKALSQEHNREDQMKNGTTKKTQRSPKPRYDDLEGEKSKLAQMSMLRKLTN